MSAFLEYVPGDSLLHRLNPVAKLGAAALFAVACFCSGSFVFLAVGELTGRFKNVRFLGALIAFACLAVGGCVSVLHMGHPERATHLLGNLGSGLSKELFIVAIMGIVSLVYLILAKKDYPGVSKVLGVLGALLFGVGMCLSRKMVLGIVIGLVGIVALLMLIPLTKGIH